MSEHTYVCECCGETCITERSDDDAMKEAVAVFGPQTKRDEMAIVCYDCYQRMMLFFAEHPL